MNIETGIDVYLRQRHGVLRPQTISKHRMTLMILARHFAGRELGTITPAELIDWRNSLPLKASSANKYMDRVAAFYRHMVRFDYARTNPVDKIDPLDEGPVRRIRLPNEALPLMLEAARHPRDRALIAVALELLLRGGELAELRVGDVEDGYLRVTVEKGDGEFAIDEMATSETLERELRAWLRYLRQQAGMVTADAYLFPRLRTRLVGSESQYYLAADQKLAHPEEVIKLALRAAGVPVEKGTGVHAIRRTCARLLFDHLVTQAGADRALAHVSSLMHHASRRTTELYLGVTGDRVLRNKMIREGGPTPLALAIATVDELPGPVSAKQVVYLAGLDAV